MSFMKPEIMCGVFYRVETRHCGATFVPADIVKDAPSLEDFQLYVEGSPLSFETVNGIFARLSAPGYLDCTEWSGPYASKRAAILDLAEMYGDVDDSEKLITGTLAKTLEGDAVYMPDREITEDMPTCTLVPLQGFSDRVAVVDGDGECIGWIRTDGGTQ